MKDKISRVLAIIALVTMGIFIAALIATLVDHTLFNNSIGFIALGAGVFTLMIFIALKADGRGFSMTKINNEIEMEKIEKKLAEQAEKEQAEKAAADEAKNDDEAENAEADADTDTSVGEETAAGNDGGEHNGGEGESV